MTIDVLINKHEAFDIIKTLRQALENTKEDLLEVQRLQMLEGIASDGRKIGKYKSPLYSEKKFELNPVPGLGTPDLKLTGEWQGELSVTITDREVQIIAPDNNKSAQLINTYSLVILGLSEKNLAIYSNEYLKPEFLILAKDALR